MEIEVQFFAFLRHYLPSGSADFSAKLHLDGPVTVADVFRKLEIPEDVVQSISILMVNGAHASKDRVLADGDVLTVLPVAAGG